MTEPIFDAASREALAALYPETPGRIGHNLVGHPLLEVEALVKLSQRIRPVDVEQNLADIPIGIDPDALSHNGMSVEESIRSIEQNGSWMVLKFVQQDPVYRALLDALLDEIAPLVEPVTGRMLQREAFIFVSSPGAVTPFHFDPEHNILLQIRGTKTMTIFPADDPGIVHPKAHEAFHRGAHRNLPWDDRFGAHGTAVDLAPGEAVYVPVKAPHWVKNGPAMSISLSITWRSEWSYREEQAHAMNHLLRRAGLDPAAPRRFPAQNMAKSVAYRAIQKARRIAGKP